MLIIEKGKFVFRFELKKNAFSLKYTRFKISTQKHIMYSNNLSQKMKLSTRIQSNKVKLFLVKNPTAAAFQKQMLTLPVKITMATPTSEMLSVKTCRLTLFQSDNFYLLINTVKLLISF